MSVNSNRQSKKAPSNLPPPKSLNSPKKQKGDVKLIDIIPPAPSKEVDKKFELDHNNLLRSMEEMKPRRPHNLKKTTLSAPIRNYPGVQVSQRFDIRGAIYADELDKEDIEIQKLYMPILGLENKTNEEISEEYKALDLLRDSEYLKIDQSKLPLEIFDDDEYIKLGMSLLLILLLLLLLYY